MKKEIVALLEYWEKEKGIEKSYLIESLEDGLLTVYRKKAGLPEDIRIKIDCESGDIKFINEKGEEVPPPNFPWARIAAQTARQVLLQKIREAEKNTIYKEFKKLEGEIISGIVERFENENIVVTIGKKAEGLLPHHHRLANDHFRIGDGIKCYLLEVRPPSKGNYQLILSRTHPDFVRKLLENEIPEIKEKIVEIKALARFPGDLTKVAVYSNNEKVDPVGTCIGDKAARIKNIVKELKGEKIEVIPWDENIVNFIKNSLAPAKTKEVYINEEKKEAIVIVDDDQLFLAIGKKGQNVRLASKLTGWNIKVFKTSEYKKETAENLK
ncbi:MAG: transcription termination factor NusA [Candidatus Omnitrophica bacterium]|nr:transcription termination factor NusA [Candidatus Omnitrophota bacterium]MCM8807051.1 transcription termination factor NusA [Candidatus Omnitrophota bacterium]